ncbi:hypothetical protein KDC22_07255 [Paenibacillus tritici]|uniref:hypothetical protein n=1 Tax=Paenibacillus tritici TaxID=1873425 RepID=UPI001BAD37C9|nr:hypothetical protein [Paenibacillus tritici]QUL56294.1 hypothetical protein KDC22_07255 [Paenibacillus tritici]
MFTTYRLELPDPVTLNKLQIPVFTHMFLQQVSAHKVQVDPIQGKRISITYLSAYPREQIEQEVDAFLERFTRKPNEHPAASEEAREHTLDVVELNEPPLESLCSCCKPSNLMNISDDLVEQGWLTLLKNQELAYHRPIIRLLEYFDQSYVDYVGRKIGDCQERQYSVLLPTAFAEKMNYFHSAPMHLLLATHLSHDQEKMLSFAEDVSRSNGRLPEDSGQYLEAPPYVLQSAPCYKVYLEMEDRVLEDNTAFVLKGQSFRNEGKRVYLLERLLNFTMREFVFLGTPDYVTRMRDLTLQWTMEWMETVGLKGECALANDPFFLPAKVKQNFKVPKHVKYEVRADIPYKNDTISIASYDTHGDFFAKTFNFRLRDNTETWSGCIGLGLERVVWSFLQQYGLDHDNWPEAIPESAQ